jgi:hypothetical protein
MTVLTRFAQRRSETVRHRWRAASATCAFPMTEWDDPANDALLERLVAGADPMPAVADVAHARHEAGFTFNETGIDLRNLRDVLPRPQARSLEPFEMVMTIGDVFLEASYAPSGPTSSGLPDEVYLLQRIQETYRPLQAGWPWTLGVVRLSPLADRFDGLLRRLQVVPVVQQGFAGAATLGVVGEDCFVALFAGTGEATAACQTSTANLAAEGVANAEWWVQPLPEDPLDLEAVLAGLHRAQ